MVIDVDYDILDQVWINRYNISLNIYKNITAFLFTLVLFELKYYPVVE